jgi:hypothetical protein
MADDLAARRRQNPQPRRLRYALWAMTIFSSHPPFKHITEKKLGVWHT